MKEIWTEWIGRGLLTDWFATICTLVFFPMLWYPLWKWPSIVDLFRVFTGWITTILGESSDIEWWVYLSCMAGFSGGIGGLQLVNLRLPVRKRVGRAFVLCFGGIPLGIGGAKGFLLWEAIGRVSPLGGLALLVWVGMILVCKLFITICLLCIIVYPLLSGEARERLGRVFQRL